MESLICNNPKRFEYLEKITLVSPWTYESLAFLIIEISRSWNLEAFEYIENLNSQTPRRFQYFRKIKLVRPKHQETLNYFLIWESENLETWKPWNLGILKAWTPKTQEDFQYLEKIKLVMPWSDEALEFVNLEILKSWNLETLEYRKPESPKPTKILIFRKDQARETLISWSL